MKQERNISQTEGITFSWKEVDCEQRNGLLLGYEIKLDYGEEVCTRRVVESITTFTILRPWKPELCFPKAISVAAINEVGVGDHCPPVNIKLSGLTQSKLACKQCKTPTMYIKHIAEHQKALLCVFVIEKLIGTSP